MPSAPNISAIGSSWSSSQRRAPASRLISSSRDRVSTFSRSDAAEEARPDQTARRQELDGEPACLGFLNPVPAGVWKGRPRRRKVRLRASEAGLRRCLVAGVEEVAEFVADGEATALRGRCSPHHDDAFVPLLCRDERSFKAASGGSANLDDVEGSGDRRDRNRSLRKAELIVDGRCEALGIAANVLDRHAIELKRLSARHALLFQFSPAA